MRPESTRWRITCCTSSTCEPTTGRCGRKPTIWHDTTRCIHVDSSGCAPTWDIACALHGFGNANDMTLSKPSCASAIEELRGFQECCGFISRVRTAQSACGDRSTRGIPTEEV